MKEITSKDWRKVCDATTKAEKEAAWQSLFQKYDVTLTKEDLKDLMIGVNRKRLTIHRLPPGQIS